MYGARTREAAIKIEPGPSLSSPTVLKALSTPETSGRTLTCVVSTPVGRVLSDFRDVKELLKALRDAVIAHRSLLTDAGILHRDVSAHNVVIVNRVMRSEEGQGNHGKADAGAKGKGKETFSEEPPEVPKVAGMLIDVDMAMRTSDDVSDPDHITGTRVYMSIRSLLQQGHSYRDDLESFLYVLIWMCRRYQSSASTHSGAGPSTHLNLDKWNESSMEVAAWAKYRHMTDSKALFSRILGLPSSLECVETLCHEVRHTLFGQVPPTFDDKFTPVFHVPEDSDSLYLPIIASFDIALASL